MTTLFSRLLAQSESGAVGSGPGLVIPGFGEERFWYYVVCALVFTMAGLVTGYFIWRKGAMQTQDAEVEIRRTAGELQRLSEDLKVEESAL